MTSPALFKGYPGDTLSLGFRVLGTDQVPVNISTWELHVSVDPSPLSTAETAIYGHSPLDIGVSEASRGEFGFTLSAEQTAALGSGIYYLTIERVLGNIRTTMLNGVLELVPLETPTGEIVDHVLTIQIEQPEGVVILEGKALSPEVQGYLDNIRDVAVEARDAAISASNAAAVAAQQAADHAELATSVDLLVGPKGDKGDPGPKGDTGPYYEIDVAVDVDVDSTGSSLTTTFTTVFSGSQTLVHLPEPNQGTYIVKGQPVGETATKSIISTITLPFNVASDDTETTNARMSGSVYLAGTKIVMANWYKSGGFRLIGVDLSNGTPVEYNITEIRKETHTVNVTLDATATSTVTKELIGTPATGGGGTDPEEPAEPTYDNSSEAILDVTGVTFNPANHRQIGGEADNFTMTVLNDGSVLVLASDGDWEGDGTGEQLFSCALYRINYPNNSRDFTMANVTRVLSFPYFQKNVAGMFGHGILAVGSTVYCMLSQCTGSWKQYYGVKMFKSPDNGVTWYLVKANGTEVNVTADPELALLKTADQYFFYQGNGAAGTVKNDGTTSYTYYPFSMVSFLQDGAAFDHGLERSPYIYAYAPDSVQATDMNMARVRFDEVTDITKWEYFAGYDVNDLPTWTPNIADRAVAMSIPSNDGTYNARWYSNLPSVVFIPTLGQYLLVTGAMWGTRYNAINAAPSTGSLSVNTSPQPYGPFENVSYTANFSGGRSDALTYLPTIDPRNLPTAGGVVNLMYSDHANNFNVSNYTYNDILMVMATKAVSTGPVDPLVITASAVPISDTEFDLTFQSISAGTYYLQKRLTTSTIWADYKQVTVAANTSSTSRSTGNEPLKEYTLRIFGPNGEKSADFTVTTLAGEPGTDETVSFRTNPLGYQYTLDTAQYPQLNLVGVAPLHTANGSASRLIAENNGSGALSIVKHTKAPSGRTKRATVTLWGSSSGYSGVGPALINDDGNGYWLWVRNLTEASIRKVVNNGEFYDVEIGAVLNAGSWVNDTSFSLEIDELTGTLNAYKNGVLLGSRTDTTYSTGLAPCFAFQQGSAVRDRGVYDFTAHNMVTSNAGTPTDGGGTGSTSGLSALVKRTDFDAYADGDAVNDAFAWWGGYYAEMGVGNLASSEVTLPGRAASMKTFFKKNWDGLITGGNKAHSYGGQMNIPGSLGNGDEVWWGYGVYVPTGFDFRSNVGSNPSYSAQEKGRGLDKTHPRDGWHSLKHWRVTDNSGLGGRIEHHILSDNNGKHKGWNLPRESQDRSVCDTSFPTHDDVCFKEDQWNYVSIYMKLAGPSNKDEGVQRIHVNGKLAFEWAGPNQTWYHPDGTYHTMTGANMHPLLLSDDAILSVVLYYTYWNGGGHILDVDGVTILKDDYTAATHPKKDQVLYTDAFVQANQTPTAFDEFGNPYLSENDIRYSGRSDNPGAGNNGGTDHGTVTPVDPTPVESTVGGYTAQSVLARTSGRVIYVDLQGNDASSGLTSGTAVRSWEPAIAIAQPGDLVCITEGTYIQKSPSTAGWSSTRTSVVIQKSGTEMYPIYLEGSGNVILDSEGTRLGMLIGSKDYIRIKNIQFDNCHVQGIFSYGYSRTEVMPETTTKNLWVENCRFNRLTIKPGVNCSMVGIWGTTGAVIRNNLFKHPDSNSPAFAMQAFGLINALIEHNEVENYNMAVYWKDHHVLDLETRAKPFESEIRYNKFQANRYAIQIGSSGDGAPEAGHTFIHHNILKYGHLSQEVSAGVFGNMSIGKNKSGQLRVEHNIFDGGNFSGTTGMIFDAFEPTENKGNIFLRNALDISAPLYGMSKAAPLTASNHNVFDESCKVVMDRFASQYGLPNTERYYNSLTEWKSASAADTVMLGFDNPDANSISVNSANMFQDLASGNYRPASGSSYAGIMPDGSNAGPYQTGSEVIGRTTAATVPPVDPTPTTPPPEGTSTPFTLSFVPERVVPTFAQATHYASPTKTTDGNGTLANPWTFDQAMANAVAGNIVGLLPGKWYGEEPVNEGILSDPTQRRLYPAFRPANSGTAAQPIWFVAQNPAHTSTSGWTEIYSGGSLEWDSWPAFGSYRKDYILYSGIYSSELDPNGQTRNDCGVATVREGKGCGVFKCRLIGKYNPNDNNSGVRIEDMIHGEVADNVIDGFEGGTNNSGVIGYRNIGLRTHHNDFSNCEHVFQMKGGPNGFRFYNNKVNNCKHLLRFNSPYAETDTDYGWVYNNTCSSIGYIYEMTTSAGFMRIDGVSIFNNTFYNITKAHDPAAIWWASSIPSGVMDNAFFNNIIHTSHSFIGSYQGSPSTPAALANYIKSNRNVFHNMTKFFNAGPLGSFTSANWQAAGQDVNSVFANPLLTNKDAGDFTLQSGSPARNAGRDLLGQFGPVNGVVHIGARPLGGNDVIGVRDGVVPSTPPSGGGTDSGSASNSPIVIDYSVNAQDPSLFNTGRAYSPSSVRAISSGKEFFVNPLGNDAASGTSSGMAVKTPQKALTLMQPGDKMILAAGRYFLNGQTSPLTQNIVPKSGEGSTYFVLTMNKSGTVLYPMYMEAANNALYKAVIDGQGTMGGILLGSESYWQIRGLQFEDNLNHGILHWDQTGNAIPNMGSIGKLLVIDNNRFFRLAGTSGVNTASIGIRGTQGAEVTNNYVEDSVYGVQSYGCFNAMVKNNTFNKVYMGVYWKDHHVLDGDWTLPFTSEVCNNLIYCRDDMPSNKPPTGIWLNGSAGKEPVGHNYIHHNIILNYGIAGVYMNANAAAAQSGEQIIEHNVFDGRNKWSGAVGVFLTEGHPVKLKGNLFANNYNDIWTVVQSSTKYPELEYSNYNVFQGEVNIKTDVYIDSAVGSTDVYTSLAAWRSAPQSSSVTLKVTNPDANSVVAAANSLWINPTGETGDYHNKVGSAAIGIMPDGSNAGPYQTGDEVIGFIGSGTGYTPPTTPTTPPPTTGTNTMTVQDFTVGGSSAGVPVTSTNYPDLSRHTIAPVVKSDGGLTFLQALSDSSGEFSTLRYTPSLTGSVRKAAIKVWGNSSGWANIAVALLDPLGFGYVFQMANGTDGKLYKVKGFDSKGSIRISGTDQIGTTFSLGSWTTDQEFSLKVDTVSGKVECCKGTSVVRSVYDSTYKTDLNPAVLLHRTTSVRNRGIRKLYN